MKPFLYLPVVYLVVAGIAAYVLNLFLIQLSQRMRSLSLDNGGNQVRWANRSKPMVGGLTFFLVFFGALIFLLLSPGQSPSAQLIPLVCISILAFLIGLFDDAYNTRPVLKFSGQVLVGILLILFDVTIRLTGVEWLDLSLTLIWVVGIMNSYNMMDNMDGVSASFSLVVFTAAAFVVGIYHPHDSVMLPLLLALIGAHVGFLWLNWSPSKLFMGDTGSQFIGALLAFIGIVYFWNPQPSQVESFSWRGLAIPALAFGVTILDTLVVTVARLARRQSPFVGGRDHISHHLVYAGLSERQVPLVLGGISVVSCGLALLATFGHDAWPQYANFGLLAFMVSVSVIVSVAYRNGAQRMLAKASTASPSSALPKPAAEEKVSAPKPSEPRLAPSPRVPAHV
jgi:UDP-GlcNAc:undecaprenyl-phosphate GlcNAc-1-phosphate transferase